MGISGGSQSRGRKKGGGEVRWEQMVGGRERRICRGKELREPEWRGSVRGVRYGGARKVSVGVGREGVAR